MSQNAMITPEQLAMKIAIKKMMKKQKRSYEDLAEVLDVSVSTIKRNLTRDDLSMDRIIKIADWLGVTFYELVEISTKDPIKGDALSVEEEELLVRFPELGIIYWPLVLGKSYESYIEELRGMFSRKTLDQHLATLEEYGLIAPNGNGGYESQKKWPLGWHFRGPLSEAFSEKVVDLFVLRMKQKLKAIDPTGINKTPSNFVYKVEQMMLSEEAYTRYKKEVGEVVLSYYKLSRLEVATKENLQPVSSLVAIDQYDSITECFKDVYCS